jgi:hypothetical protein
MPVEEMTPGVARLRTLIANIYLVGSPGRTVGAGGYGHSGQCGAHTGCGRAAFWPGRASRGDSADARASGSRRFRAGTGRILGRADLCAPAGAAVPQRQVGLSAERSHGGRRVFVPEPVLSEFVRWIVGARLRDLPEGGEVPGPGGLALALHARPCAGTCRVLPPVRESVLLAGDACATMDLDSAMRRFWRRSRASARPPAPFTYDWDQAQRSVANGWPNCGPQRSARGTASR